MYLLIFDLSVVTEPINAIQFNSIQFKGLI